MPFPGVAGQEPWECGEAVPGPGPVLRAVPEPLQLQRRERDLGWGWAQTPLLGAPGQALPCQPRSCAPQNSGEGS